MSHESLTGALDVGLDELRAKYAHERDRRRRPKGSAQYAPTLGGRFDHYSQDMWTNPPPPREPQFDHTQAVVLGGGIGGLVTAARLSMAGITDIRMIEVGGDFGGTWYWNRYPGAMCDIEAHIYMPLLEELNYAPRHRYAYADEIFEHCQRIGKTYGLYDKALLSTVVTHAQFNEESRRWEISTDLGDRITADIFVVATGTLTLPKLPNLPGIDEYQGHIFHSSRWDYKYTGGDLHGGLTGLTDKRIGVVGTGATSLQIVPSVAKYAQELFVFQRTPSTVGPRGQRETDDNWVDMSEPGWQRKRRENFQAHVNLGPPPEGGLPELNLVGDGWTEAVATLVNSDDLVARLGHTPTAEESALIAELTDANLMNQLRNRIDEAVEDSETAEALKPWYRFWCKRPGWHDEYLPAFNRKNVHLVDTAGAGIERFTPSGVVVAGTEYELDCVVMATGFEAGVTSYRHSAGFDIVGRDGVSLSDHWKTGVRTLHGITTDGGFPNLMFVGTNPQTASAVNAAHILDEQARYVAHLVSTSMRHDAQLIEASSAAVSEWVSVIAESPENQALLRFYSECTPGYYNAEGDASDQSELYSGGKYGPGPLAYYSILHDWAESPGLPGYELT